MKTAKITISLALFNRRQVILKKKNQIWKIIKPKFSEKNLKDAKIALVQNNGIVSQISELAKFLKIIS